MYKDKKQGLLIALMCFFLHYPIPSETQAYRDSKILEILLQLLFFTQNVLHLKGNA